MNNTNKLIEKTLQLAENGTLPDCLIRLGIRNLLKKRLAEIEAFDCESAQRNMMQLIASMQSSEIAPLPAKANAQHYEVPEAFYALCLGKHRKYSSCYWTPDTPDLDSAEALALQLTSQHARLMDGQSVLELGCGWGSLSLWMAEQYPHSTITGVSNSNSQREYILSQAKQRGLHNLNIITADMNHFVADTQYDRIVSVEMFEHMRNYQVLYQRVASWLKPEGLFFKHIFVHRNTPYAFEVMSNDDWMSQYFFSGGMMPSDDLPLFFQDHLKLIDKWRWEGSHYEKTANAWLQQMDKHSKALTPVLQAIYGTQEAEIWRQRWRIFFMACAELFGYDHGQTWWVTHYLFQKT